MRVLVLALVLMAGGAEASPVTFRGMTIDLPCARQPVVLEHGLFVNCDGTLLAVETTSSTAARYLAQAFHDVPAHQQTSDGHVGVALIGEGVLVVVAYDPTPARKGLAFLGIAPTVAAFQDTYARVRAMAAAAATD